MVINVSRTLAVASVALVVLIDLATGQGPPIFTNYMQSQRDYNQPPPPPPPQAVRPMAYMQPASYPQGIELDKDYKKAIEYDDNKGYKEEKKLEKELIKESKKEEKENYDKDDAETTPAPGVLSSFSNSMNDAWKSISSLGRSKRNAPNETAKTMTSAISAEGNPTTKLIDAKSDSFVTTAAPVERSADDIEQLQDKNQGYVYFKVPKYLVCNY